LKPAVLIIQQNGIDANKHVIDAEDTLIGRSVHSDVKLADPGVSREHATITWDGERYVVEDLQSTNGTKVNDRRIRSCELEHNAQIQIGRTTIIFRLQDD